MLASVHSGFWQIQESDRYVAIKLRLDKIVNTNDLSGGIEYIIDILNGRLETVPITYTDGNGMDLEHCVYIYRGYWVLIGCNVEE